MRKAKLLFWVVLGIIAFLSNSAVYGVEQKAAGDGGSAIRKAQGLIRQLSQEKSALEAEKAQWQNEKTELQVKLKNLEDAVKKLQPLQAEVGRYKTDLETTRKNLDDELGRERQQKQALLQKHNEVVLKANAINGDNQLLVEAVKEREQWIAQCAKTNNELRTLNLEIISKYKQKGFWEELAEREPITGLGSIESETLIENYRYKLQQLKMTPFKSKTEQTESVPENSNPENRENL